MIMFDLLQNMILPMLDLRLDPPRRPGSLPLHQPAMLPMQLALMIAILLELVPRSTGAMFLVMLAAAHRQDPGRDVVAARGGTALAGRRGIGVGIRARHLVADLLVVVGGVEDREDVLQVVVLGRQFLVVVAEAVPEAEGDVDVADDAVGELAVGGEAVGFGALQVGVAGEDGQAEGAVVFVGEVFEPEDGEGRRLVEGHGDVLPELDDEARAVAFAHRDPHLAVFFAGPGTVVVGGHFAFADGRAELEAEVLKGGGEVGGFDGTGNFEGAVVPSQKFSRCLKLYRSEDHRDASSTVSYAANKWVGLVDLRAFPEDVSQRKVDDTE